MEKSFLEGHTISLRVPCEDDIKINGWSDWYNDYQITRYNRHGVFPVSQNQEWKIVSSEMNNSSSILLAIYQKETEKLLGNICLQKIDLVNRTARLAVTIGVSASPTACVEAFGLMLNHAFMRLNLNRIYDGTHENLLNFVKSLGVFGYRIEGRGPEHYLKDGNTGDLIYYGILRKVFLEKLKLRHSKILFENKDELLSAIRAEMRK